MSGVYLIGVLRALARCLLGGSGRCLEESGQVKGQVRKGQVRTGPVRTGQVRTSQFRSGQVR